MNLYSRILKQLNTGQNVGYSFIRIFLGIALFVRGWHLVSDPGAIVEIVGDQKLHMFYSYITILHLIGGLLIAFGLFTRVGALVQIPILFAATFIVHAESGLMMGGQSLELAGLVLFLLVVFLLFGSGPLSVADYVNKRRLDAVLESKKESPA